MTNQDTINTVHGLLCSTLGLEASQLPLAPGTPLFGAIPELDSMSVLEVLVAVEDRFAISISDNDYSGDLFDTLGSLAGFIDSMRQ